MKYIYIYTLFRHEAAIVQKHIKAQKHKHTKNRHGNQREQSNYKNRTEKKIK